MQATGADTVICDGELAPSQLRNLEDRLKVKVVDRTALILDIFAQHAKSEGGPGADRAGPAQLHEAAAARLGRQPVPPGRWPSRRRGGGIGGRGPGETKIETDRRRINTKIAKLRRELRDMKGTRDTKRQERRRNHIPSVSIAGYTNAGKSSLLNRLTDAGVLVEDALFATLDPTTRRTTTTDGRVYTMSDTVGFVRHLPHQLVEAFRSHAGGGRRRRPDPARRRRLPPRPRGPARPPSARCSPRSAASQVPELVVINKADVADPMVVARLRQREPHSVVVSARTGEGIAEALAIIESELPRPDVEFSALLPYERGDLINRLHQHGEIASMEHTADGTLVSGRANEDLAGELVGVRRLTSRP